jgi:hypothetical protein
MVKFCFGICINDFKKTMKFLLSDNPVTDRFQIPVPLE